MSGPRMLHCYLNGGSMDDRTEFNRLSWHSRRGMLEIDVMLMPFTEHQYLEFVRQ